MQTRALFPGTFDPFTLSHKGIVRAIRDRGFEVLLAIDEFSWSKRTQPYRIRRRMGMLFQFGALFTDLSVFDNVAFPMREQDRKSVV